ncbi:MAG TPA: hypothetical protein VGN97_22865 [Mesorhizobium sp.]|jgi:hypothetical protein|nr:hypothetical protein [Mesorhizobium sp.]
MFTDLSHENEASNRGEKKPRRKAKDNLSALDRLSSEELQTLRLDEASRSEFNGLVQRFNGSRADLRPFEREDTASMDDARYDELSAAQAKQSSDGMGVVHFLAPRILRMRDGAAKRKWRSFLTKFRKDERLG